MKISNWNGFSKVEQIKGFSIFWPIAYKKKCTVESGNFELWPGGNSFRNFELWSGGKFSGKTLISSVICQNRENKKNLKIFSENREFFKIFSKIPKKLYLL